MTLTNHVGRHHVLPSSPPAAVTDANTDSDEAIQSILDHLPSMIGCWDRHLRYRYANQAYKHWFGIAPEDMKGKHLREIIGEERYRLNLPYIEAALRGEPQTFERAIPTPDGRQIRHSLAHYIPDIHDGEVAGFFVLVSDITAVKQAAALAQQNQELLQKNEELYRAVVQDQTEVISRLRADGTYTFANEVFYRFFGKTPDELLDANWHPMVYPEDIERVAHELSALSPDNPVVMIENRVYSATGQLHWMQFSNRGSFDANGNLVEIQSVGRDITDRKNTETSLQLAHEELQRRVTQLRQLAVDTTLIEERERQAIAHDLHDDLGQSLHIVKLKLDALAKRSANPADPAFAELDTLIGDASRVVRSLTTQISPPVLRDLGLIPALHWLVEEMDRHYGLTVQITAPSTPDADSASPGVAQSAVIFRTVRELLINVAKHAGVSAARLSISQEKGMLHIAVSDQGKGMNTDTALKKPDTHGLTSVRERIDVLGGSTTIHSAIGEGSCITIHMPLSKRGSTS